MRKRIASAVASFAVVAGASTAYLDANRPAPRQRFAIDAGIDTGCVIPDCRSLLGHGAWDDAHGPVDCMAVGPYSPDGGPVWRGCSVLRAEYATGTACLRARCSVVAGEDPVEER